MLTDRPTGLAAVFTPRRVALVGASERAGSMGCLLWSNLGTFPGEVVPVNPSAGTVGGRTAYRSLRDIEGEVDLAVVVVPAPAVPGVIRDAAAAGVPAAIVISGGFAETGAAGLRLQRELLAAARTGGVRLVGPNCFGVQNCDLPLNASIAAGLPAGGGGLSLITQSGAYGMAAHALALDERVRFAKIYAPGNKADIGDHEVLAYLRGDPATRVICCYLESLAGGRALYEEIARTTPTKPVVVMKTGRSPAGARAARSHTAALAAPERVLSAALDQAGAVQVRSGLEMLDVARALTSQPVPSGPRVAVITNSGGTGVELADLLTDAGLEVPELSAGLRSELARELPAGASPRNPVDITPVWSRFAELYPMLIERLARSGEVDAIVPVLLQRSALEQRVALAVRDAAVRLRREAPAVGVYVCWVAPNAARPNADLLQEAGIPCFEWPERTARAIGHALRAGLSRVAVEAPRPARPARSGREPLPSGWLDVEKAATVLRQAGIPIAASRVCADPLEASRAAAALGFPAVVKLLHRDVVHKSEHGGVRTGLLRPEEVREAAAMLLTLAPGARVLVQHQATGVELLVGGVRDQEFGPTVAVGSGGVLAEVLDDVAFALAPLSEDEARRLLRRLRCYPRLTGTRGTQPVDVDALARTVSAVGDLLVEAPEIAEVDLNPVLAGTEGCEAVDWRVLVRRSSARDERQAASSPSESDETPRPVA